MASLKPVPHGVTTACHSLRWLLLVLFPAALLTVNVAHRLLLSNDYHRHSAIVVLPRPHRRTIYVRDDPDASWQGWLLTNALPLAGITPIACLSCVFPEACANNKNGLVDKVPTSLRFAG